MRIKKSFTISHTQHRTLPISTPHFNKREKNEEGENPHWEQEKVKKERKQIS